MMRRRYSESVVCLFCLCLVVTNISHAEVDAAAKSDGTIRELIADLGNRRWGVRSTAQKRLTEIGKREPKRVIDHCVPALKTSDDPEVEFRLIDVLEATVLDARFRAGAGFLGIAMGQNRRHVKVDGQAYLTIPVMQVLPNYGALKAGVKASDGILAVDDHKCGEKFGVKEFIAYISLRKPGGTVSLKVLRGDETVTLEIDVGVRPLSSGGKLRKQRQKEFFDSWLAEELKKRNKPVVEKSR